MDGFGPRGSVRSRARRRCSRIVLAISGSSAPGGACVRYGAPARTGCGRPQPAHPPDHVHSRVAYLLVHPGQPIGLAPGAHFSKQAGNAPVIVRRAAPAFQPRLSRPPKPRPSCRRVPPSRSSLRQGLEALIAGFDQAHRYCIIGGFRAGVIVHSHLLRGASMSSVEQGFGRRHADRRRSVLIVHDGFQHVQRVLGFLLRQLGQRLRPRPPRERRLPPPPLFMVTILKASYDLRTIFRRSLGET